MQTMKELTTKHQRMLLGLVAPTIGALILLFFRILSTGSLRYSFMIWNLCLAWLALGAAILAIYILNSKINLWVKLVSVIIWVLLLPNTFYILTDFIHVHFTGEVNVLFDVVLMAQFAAAGIIYGCLSLLLMHKTFIRLSSQRFALSLIILIIFATSFAIDLGRYLRWNSWDVVLDPTGILFDVSERVLSPSAYGRSMLTTAMFFVFIGTVYFSTWQFYSFIKTEKNKR